MKINRINLLKEFLVSQINNLIFYPIALTLISFCSGFIPPIRTSLILWMLYGTFPLLLYYVRCRAKKLISFITFHLLYVGGVILLAYGGGSLPFSLFACLNNPVNRLMMMISCIFFVHYSIYQRIHNKAELEIVSMPVIVGIASVALYLQQYHGIYKWNSYYTMTLIIILAFYFIQYYLKEYLNFLVVNASSTGMLPEKEIFFSGLRLTSFYTLSGVLVLIAASQYTWLKNLLNMFTNFIGASFVLLQKLFSKTETPAKPAELIATESTSNDGVKMMLPDGNKTALIWKILEVITVIAVFVAIIFLLIKLFLTLISIIKRIMNRNIKTQEAELTATRDVREKCEKTRSQKHSLQPRELFGFLDAKERIRRIYKKKAASYKPLRFNERETQKQKSFSPERLMYYTAKEMECEMHSGSFAEIYEKARYSNEECTGLDVKRMKEMCH